MSRSGNWDPENSPDWDSKQPSSTCLLRLKRELSAIYEDPPQGMFILPDKNDICKMHALIIGPSGTPYEGGFFYFYIRTPPDYPINPPRVKLLTTGGGTVRFNPNLYANGKVCLSLIGTWDGPAWSPALNLTSLLLSIQSLMNEHPYNNEPGYERERYAGDVQRYNEIIRHETIRIAVCGMLERRDLPGPLMELMENAYLETYESFVQVCEKNASLSGQKMRDPFGEQRGSYDYRNLLTRLSALQTRCKGELQTSS